MSKKRGDESWSRTPAFFCPLAAMLGFSTLPDEVPSVLAPSKSQRRKIRPSPISPLPRSFCEREVMEILLFAKPGALQCSQGTLIGTRCNSDWLQRYTMEARQSSSISSFLKTAKRLPRGTIETRVDSWFRLNFGQHSRIVFHSLRKNSLSFREMFGMRRPKQSGREK